MVVIDSDVLFLAFAFHQDPRRPVNSTFLEKVQADQPAITIYNLMETLGKLSFNLAPEQLDAWESWLIDAYQLTVIWPTRPDVALDHLTFREEFFTRPYAIMRSHKMPLMDALILNLAERTPGVTRLVTWNARHFQKKSSLIVITPEEYLR